MPPAWKLLLAVAVEVLYAVSTRAWLPDHVQGIELELAVTGVRGITALVYWRLFRELITSRTPTPGAARGALVPVSLALLALAPVLAGDWALPDAETRVVFALTSFVVGLREELLYRGVLQNLLEGPLGWLWAILVSNVVFTLYHYGAWPFTFRNLAEFFLVGTLLGLLYRGTGSLWAVVIVHGVYDALWCYTPMLDSPLHWSWGTGLQGAALAVMLAWAWGRISKVT